MPTQVAFFASIAFSLVAFYQANASGLSPGQLGATYFIPTVVVPRLLITHGLAFRILLRRDNESAIPQIRP